MNDFGRVGRLAWDSGESTFMVIGPSSEPVIRTEVNDYRQTVILIGSGTWGGGYPSRAGEFAPVHVDDPRIEWLDDE